jgi:hypothetical protein
MLSMWNFLNNGGESVLAQDWMSDNMISNVVAQYKMNDNAASTAVVDEQGTNGTAQANTSTLDTTGVVGGALTFNGSSDYIDTNQTFQATFRDSFSVNLWCKPDDGQPAANQTLVANYGASDNLFRVMLLPTGKLYCSYIVGGGSITALDSVVVFSNGTGSWTMITAVFEKISATSARILLYSNGVLVETGATASVVMANFTSANDVLIGAYRGIEPLRFDGSLDNVIIFDKALNSEEVSILYNSGRGTEDFQLDGNMQLSNNGSQLLSMVGK